jgi:predicted membrane protein
MEINITNLSYTKDPLKTGEITTEYLMKLCGLMDTQVYHAAIIGFILSLLIIIYFGRIRDHLIKKLTQTWIIPLLDKTLLIGIAMTFAFIITRLLRAG